MKPLIAFALGLFVAGSALAQTERMSLISIDRATGWVQVQWPMFAFAVQNTEPAPRAKFTDVPENHWAAEAVTRLVARNIMNGRPDGSFEGEKPVTRFELAVALDRFIQQIEAGLKKGGEAVNELKTTSNVKIVAPKNHWARDPLTRLASRGFLPAGNKVLVGPEATLTAEEIGEALGFVGKRIVDMVGREPDEAE